jgi:hypothetical protein
MHSTVISDSIECRTSLPRAGAPHPAPTRCRASPGGPGSQVRQGMGARDHFCAITSAPSLLRHHFCAITVPRAARLGPPWQRERPRLLVLTLT